MRIGQLAQATGVSSRSLRHYEMKGLLKPHRYQNGYRDYSEAALLQVERIRWLLSAGLTTKAIRRMLPCVLEEGPAVMNVPPYGAISPKNARHVEHAGQLGSSLYSRIPPQCERAASNQRDTDFTSK